MNEIVLVKVNPAKHEHVHLLYELLKERTPEQSISHKTIPSYAAHDSFVQSEPYAAWYLIARKIPNLPSYSFVGSTYLSKQNEIGIFVFKQYQGSGYGKLAVVELMKMHKGPFLANVNPRNRRSQWLFESLGFNLLQVTYVSK